MRFIEEGKAAKSHPDCLTSMQLCSVVSLQKVHEGAIQVLLYSLEG